MKKQLLLILLSVLLITTCKKKDADKMTISGNVMDTYFHSSVGNVFVELYAKKIESGVWSNNYSRLGSLTTDQNGFFSFTFENIRSSGFKLLFHKSKYFDSEVLVNSENIEAGKEYKQNYYIFSEAFLKLKVINIIPTSSADQITYAITDGFVNNAGCCPDSTFTYIGAHVDVTKKCMTYGGAWIKFEWFVTSFGNTLLHKDSILSVPFDTVLYTISY